jgi:predicted nucleic acid-binding protein
MTFLCDTNVLSELARRQPNQGVLNWAATVRQISVSAITIEEITYGLTAKSNLRLQRWLHQFISNRCLVVPIDEAIAQRAGQLRGQLRLEGKPRSQADMLIAATASVHQLTLVTRNTRDFLDCGISLLNPFTD